MRILAMPLTALIAVLILILPMSALGEGKRNYFAVRAGVFTPSGDLDDENFDSGFNGEIAYGRYLKPFLALELAAGYYESDTTFSGSKAILGPFFENVDLKVIPVTLSLKLAYSAGRWELFAKGGLGAYYADYEGNFITGGLGNFNLDDDYVAFGGHAGIGFRFNITENIYLGLEDRYILTADAKFDANTPGGTVKIDTDLSGFVVTGNIGFRF